MPPAAPPDPRRRSSLGPLALLRTSLRLGTALIAAIGSAPVAAVDPGVPRSVVIDPPNPGALLSWADRLRNDLQALDTRMTGELGVYVRELDHQQSLSHRAEERWYLASMVKVPVALAVLHDVQRGRYTLDTPLTIRADDRVDGAGSTNAHPVGTVLTVRHLLQQMIVYSDNTASDMLIGLTGLRYVNDRLVELVPQGIGPITTLADVRRNIYGRFTPAARRLSGEDFLRLRALRSDADRVALLSRLVRVPASRFREPTLHSAYAAYYASGLNSGRLDAYGELLARVAQGDALDRIHTDHLMQLMQNVKTGDRRLKAGLPAMARLAHKTGTQRERICDAGIVSVPRLGFDQHVVVVACVRGEPTLAGAERALKEVGAALCRSGLLDLAKPHEKPCPVAPSAAPAVPAGAAVDDGP